MPKTDIRNSHGKPLSELRYRLDPYTGQQVRVAGRQVAVPELDLSGYRISAVFDFIEFRIELVQRTQFQWIQDIGQKHLGRTAYIEAIDRGPGNTANSFAVRVQEPEMGRVMGFLAEIDQKYLINSAPTILMLEISLDFWENGKHREASERLFGALSRHLFIDPDFLSRENHWPRYFCGLRDKPFFLLHGERGKRFPSLQQRIQTGNDLPAPFDGTVYWGARDEGPFMIRLMHKVMDQQNKKTGTKRDLPADEQRVRLEVCIRKQGLEEIGLRALEDLWTVSLQKIAGKCFVFKLPTFEQPIPANGSAIDAMRNRISADRLQKFLDVGMTGLLVMDEARTQIHAGRRKDLARRLRVAGRRLLPVNRRGAGENGTHVNWTEIAKRITTALRNLEIRTRRQFR